MKSSLQYRKCPIGNPVSRIFTINHEQSTCGVHTPHVVFTGGQIVSLFSTSQSGKDKKIVSKHDAPNACLESLETPVHAFAKTGNSLEKRNGSFDSGTELLCKFECTGMFPLLFRGISFSLFAHADNRDFLFQFVKFFHALVSPLIVGVAFGILTECFQVTVQRRVNQFMLNRFLLEDIVTCDELFGDLLKIDDVPEFYVFPSLPTDDELDVRFEDAEDLLVVRHRLAIQDAACGLIHDLQSQRYVFFVFLDQSAKIDVNFKGVFLARAPNGVAHLIRPDEDLLNMPQKRAIRRFEPFCRILLLGRLAVDLKKEYRPKDENKGSDSS